jgi:hypothetical protein
MRGPRDLIRVQRCGYALPGDRTAGAATTMIRNGLYHNTVEMLDGMALAGKPSTRFKSKARLLIAD